MAGVAGVGFLLWSKAKALSHLIVSPGQVVSMDFVAGMPTITFTMIAANTSSQSLLINSFAGNVFSNGTLIGNVYNFYPIAIPGNSQTPITVNVQLRLIGLVNDIIAAFQTHNFTKEISIEGFANVMGAQMPVDLKFSVGA